jgi:hypothetical protein
MRHLRRHAQDASSPRPKFSSKNAGASVADLAKLVTTIAVVGVVSTGCTGGPRPCSGSDPCSGDQVCQVGRCTSPDRLPTAPQSRRIVVEPEAFAYYDVQHGVDGVPPAELTLGATTSGTSVVLLRFAKTWSAVKTIESAFVVLEPSPGATPNAKPVPLELWRMSDNASLNKASGSFPAIGGPADASALLVFTPPQPARIDVTSLVQDIEREHGERLGVVLRAVAADGVGARYTSGSLGRAPMLELYVK